MVVSNRIQKDILKANAKLFKGSLSLDEDGDVTTCRVKVK